MSTKLNPERQLSAFQRDALRVIAQNDGCRGLKIKSVLTESYGEEINHGRLYPNLDEMADLGVIEKGEKAIDDRTNAYSVTPTGKRVLRDFEELYADALDVERTPAAADD